MDSAKAKCVYYKKDIDIKPASKKDIDIKPESKKDIDIKPASKEDNEGLHTTKTLMGMRDAAQVNLKHAKVFQSKLLGYTGDR